MKPEKRAAAKPVTARPRSLRNDASDQRAETGLSIDPEEMGQSFLRYATGQGPDRDSVPELHPDGAAASDGALSGSHFSSDASIWESTAGIVMEHGGIDEVTGEALPPAPEDEDAERDQPARGVVEVDLTESVIEEASLLDDESSVLGETVPKQPRTDDTGPNRAQDDEAD
jgi:hypothetical protein